MARSMATTITIALLFLLLPFTTVAADTPNLGWTPPERPLDWPGRLLGPSAIGGPQALHLKAGSFDPAYDEPPRILDLGGRSSPGIYLVQFLGALSPEHGRMLEVSGVDVLGFVPDGGLAVEVPAPATALRISRWSDVRAVSPWLDGWKVHPGLEGMWGEIELSLLTWREGDDVDPELDALGAEVLNHVLDHYVVRTDASRIGELASLPSVCWVEHWSPPTFLLDHASRTVGARQAENGELDPEGTAVWSYLPSPDDAFDGIIGSSVTVDVTDTGVDGTHPAFDPGLRERYYTALQPTRPDWTDPTGHGTHVAGIILGDGDYRDGEDPGLPEGKFTGIAPGAYLNAQSLYGVPVYSYRNHTLWSVKHFSDISHNSWGSTDDLGNYTVTSRDYDNATRDADWTEPGNQSILVVFAAGNWGPDQGTVSTTASAKNVIAVGACGNGKWGFDENEMVGNSSRGWTDDGRIKPDLVAPGNLVMSTWATDDPGSDGLLTIESGDHSYIGYNGTSMAAPVVTGSAALVIDYLREVEDHENPSPALVKSMLIAAADHLPTVGWPGREQGWGRVNVSRAIVEGRTLKTEWIDQTQTFYANGESIGYSFDVGAGTPLSISLVWTDVSSATYVGKTLVNDLDLEVRSPSGQTYLGNVFADNQSSSGGTPDRTNNVEVFYTASPEVGEWQVTISSAELPPVTGGGSQDFALSVNGRVNKKFVDLVARNLTFRGEDVSEGETVPMWFDLANIGDLPATGVAYKLVAMDQKGVVAETITSGIIELASMEERRISVDWVAVRGRYTIVAVPNPFRFTREESYTNNNDTKAIFVKGYGVEADIKEGYKAARPGQQVTFKIEVDNPGNVLDRFLLVRAPPPPGWTARLEATVLEIQSGASRSTSLIVGIPEGATAAVTQRINVTVTSQGNSSYMKELSTQTLVLQVHNIHVGLVENTLDAAPGETAVFQFTLTNLGNGPDTFSVSYNQLGGPTTGVAYHLARSTFSVEPGMSVEGELALSLDVANLDSLRAGVIITFTVTAESLNPDAGALASAQGSLTIKQLHAVTFNEPIPGGLTIAPGDDDAFQLNLANDGNGLERLVVEVMAPDLWISNVDQDLITMDPGSVRAVQVTIFVPGSARGALHILEVRVKTQDGTVLDSFELPIDVLWVRGVRVNLEGDHDRNMTQGDEISYTLWVTNTGNRPDTVNVTFLGLTRGLRAEARPAGLNLDIDERKSVMVVFNTTFDAEMRKGAYDILFNHGLPGEYYTVRVNITIEYSSQNGPSTGDGDDDGGMDLMNLLLVLGIILVIIVAAGGGALALRSRQQKKSLKESFFVGRTEEAPKAVRESVGPEPGRPRSPPRPPRPDEEPSQAPPQPPVATGGTCPGCGSHMEPLGPGGGMYCPVCGTKDGEPGMDNDNEDQPDTS